MFASQVVFLLCPALKEITKSANVYLACVGCFYVFLKFCDVLCVS